MKEDKPKVYQLLTNKDALHDLEQITLAAPEKLLEQLNGESKKNETDINAEILTRLLLTMLNPQAFGLNPDIDDKAGERLLTNKKIN